MPVMYNKDTVCHILKQVQHSVEIVLTRFQPVKVVADLTDYPSEMTDIKLQKSPNNRFNARS